ncbi:uridine phosphorylase 1-like [Porites lutea]|uniref:uridine phosphorylase 1-like n=1 Tax=Porites lutea TaxID=51062 RepID=UPI003CC5F485
MDLNGTDSSSASQFVSNDHLKQMDDDVLFHIGIRVGDLDIKKVFGDVKFVCMGGSTSRIKEFAKFIQNELKDYLKADQEPSNLSKSDRYVLYKVGPVLAVNHGIGVPSLMVIMHETLKLLHYAEAEHVRFFRIGTSGGLGLEPGTVVITTRAVNALLEPFSEQVILGKVVKFPTPLDEQLRKELLDCSGDILTAVGDTMCTHDFYEGQGRLDGAFCDYTLDDKLKFLQKIHDAGVRNIEMESASFAAMCNRANVSAAVLCVTLLDRLKGDQVTLTKEQHEDMQMRPARLVAKYIKKTLEQTNGDTSPPPKRNRQKAD